MFIFVAINQMKSKMPCTSKVNVLIANYFVAM